MDWDWRVGTSVSTTTQNTFVEDASLGGSNAFVEAIHDVFTMKHNVCQKSLGTSQTSSTKSLPARHPKFPMYDYISRTLLPGVGLAGMSSFPDDTVLLQSVVKQDLQRVVVRRLGVEFRAECSRNVVHRRAVVVRRPSWLYVVHRGCTSTVAGGVLGDPHRRAAGHKGSAERDGPRTVRGLLSLQLQQLRRSNNGPGVREPLRFSAVCCPRGNLL